MIASEALLAEMGRLHPKKMDLSLGRIRRLLARLGHPERHLPPVIHVAGTNGKGSTIAFTGAILRAAGQRVHVFTSPHLVRFHERIALSEGAASRPVGEAQLVALLKEVLAVNDGAPITFFEITAAAALKAFADHPADFVLLETGLGGRLDASNVVAAPAATVLTPIGLDHQDWLGDSIEQIAAEKAGIMKPGVVCVTGPQPAAVQAVIQRRADRLAAPLWQAGRDWQVHTENGRLVYQDETGLMDLPLPRLAGPFQIDNAGCAIATVRALALHDMALSDSALSGSARADVVSDEAAFSAGLTEADWPGRLALMKPGPLYAGLHADTELWLDGGHNPHAARQLAQAMADLTARSDKPLVLVSAMMSNKDAAGFFGCFGGLAARVETLAVPGSARSFSAPALAQAIAETGLAATPRDDLEAALRAAQAGFAGPVRILICGSLYLAGDVLRRSGVVF